MRPERKRFPETFNFEIWKEDGISDENIIEERYVERRAIQNDSSEFLRNNTLVLSVDATVSGWEKLEPGSEPITFIPTEVVFYMFRLIECENRYIQYLLPEQMISKFKLSSKSSYFKCLSTTQLVEDKRDAVIQEGDIYAFLAMLRFIVEGIQYLEHVTVYELYMIADKYDVQDLVKKCRDNITDLITTENVQQILSFASYFNDRELQTVVTNYLEDLEMQANETDFSQLFLKARWPLHILPLFDSRDWYMEIIQTNGIETLAIFFMHSYKYSQILNKSNFDIFI